MNGNLDHLRHEKYDPAKCFFESMPSCFMKSGKIDLNCVRNHILHCLTALWCYERGTYTSMARVFYFTLSEVATSLTELNSVISTPNVLATRFLLETFPLDNSTTKSANNDWNYANWAVVIQSLPIKQKLFAIDERRKLGIYRNNTAASTRNALLLHYAAASPSASIEVAKALASHAAVRCKDVNGRVPLHWAAMHSNSVEVLNYLLEEWPGATKAQDNDGYTPLHRLIERDQFSAQASMIERLVDADPAACSIVTTTGYNALHLFSKSVGRREIGSEDGLASQIPGILNTWNMLIAAHPDMVSQRNSSGQLPLHVLCMHRCFGQTKASLTESLLYAYKEGASVMDWKGFLPAHHVIDKKEDATELLQLLLDAYPEALSRDANTEQNMLSLAIRHSSPTMMRYLLHRSPELARIGDRDGKLPFHVAAESGDLERVKILYAAYPVAIKMFSTNGRLPLHYALKQTILELSFIDILLADVFFFLLLRYPEAANMRRLPEGVEDDDGDDDEDHDDEMIDNMCDESLPMRFTPYQLSRTNCSDFIQRILLIACPAADPQRLRELTYQARRQLMFLAFAALPPAVGTSSVRLPAARFIYQLHRLMNIGEDLGLLKHIASYL